MKRKSGYKATIRFELSEHIVDEIEDERALRGYLDAIAFIAKRNSDRVPAHRFARDLGLPGLVKLGLLELTEDGQSYVVNAFCRDRPFQLFWLKPKVKKNHRPDIRKRFAVLRRDGFRCVYCGADAESATLHVDHVRSLADGGSNDPANLVTACADCNLGKGALSLEGRLQ